MEMQQLMELLLAMREDRKADQEKALADREAEKEEMEANRKADQGKEDAQHRELMADWKAWGEEKRTTHEKIEPHPEAMQSVMEHRKVPVENAPKIPVGEPKKRRRDRKLAAERRHQKAKGLQRGNRGPPKELAVKNRRTSRRATVA